LQKIALKNVQIGNFQRQKGWHKHFLKLQNSTDTSKLRNKAVRDYIDFQLNPKTVIRPMTHVTLNRSRLHNRRKDVARSHERHEVRLEHYTDVMAGMKQSKQSLFRQTQNTASDNVKQIF
jgi:hypothetical protein